MEEMKRGQLLLLLLLLLLLQLTTLATPILTSYSKSFRFEQAEAAAAAAAAIQQDDGRLADEQRRMGTKILPTRNQPQPSSSSDLSLFLFNEKRLVGSWLTHTREETRASSGQQAAVKMNQTSQASCQQRTNERTNERATSSIAGSEQDSLPKKSFFFFFFSPRTHALI